MKIDFRKLFNVSILPSILLICSFFFITQLSSPLPQTLHLVLPYLPFIIFSIGMILSWVFHHSREFNLFLLLAIIDISLSHYIWNPDLKVDPQLAYFYLVLLIPINYLLNLVVRERGILNQYGARRFILVAVQLYCIAWLLEHPYPEIKHFLTYRIFNFVLLDNFIFSQPINLLVLLVGLVLLFKLIYSASILIAGLLYSYIAVISALYFYQTPQLATIFIILSGLLIVLNIIINAYSLAYLDELTNLPSRRALFQNTSTLGKKYSVAMVDVDHFKKFNDKYGHDIGDQVLKKLASQLRQVNDGKAFRYGGEEFTILFPNKSIDEVRVFSEQLCKKVENNPFMLRDKKRPKSQNKNNKKTKRKNTGGKPLTITISIGLAEASTQLLDCHAVIKQADLALFKAKKNGRNQVAI
ncbi:MAG: GGDEF domain-containing protein [Woeseiaceae bacterium]